MEAVAHHVSLIDRDKHEALLNKVCCPSSQGAACKAQSCDTLPLPAPSGVRHELLGAQRRYCRCAVQLDRVPGE